MVKDYGFGFHVKLFRTVSSFLTNVSALALDVIPVEILSDKGKTFFLWLVSSISLNFVSQYEKSTGRTWKYRIGDQEWNLTDIAATCYLNMTLFVGDDFFLWCYNIAENGVFLIWISLKDYILWLSSVQKRQPRYLKTMFRLHSIQW